MNKKQIPIPAGALFTVTSGEYSDYFVQGIFRAKKEIDIESAREDWLKSHPEQSGYRFNEGQFLASLSHLMDPVDCWELHLGSRGEDVITVTELTYSPLDLPEDF